MSKLVQNVSLGPCDFARPKTYTVYDDRRGGSAKSVLVASVITPIMAGETLVGSVPSSVYMRATPDPIKGETVYQIDVIGPSGRAFAFGTKALTQAFIGHVEGQIGSWAGKAFAVTLARNAFTVASADKAETPAKAGKASGKA